MPQEFKPHSHVPYGSDGSGFYSDHVDGCYQAIEKASATVLKALESVRFETNSGKAFTVADYGTADGGTSVPLLSKVIGAIKAKYGIDQEILICYEDQPTNDFKSLFLRIHGLKEEMSSYLQQYGGVYVTANGTSFFSQCFPSGSIQLAFCATAMHWLFKRPCTLRTCIHHTDSMLEEEKRAFAEEAKENWQRILVHRAKELAPGGHMVIVNLGKDGKGQYLGTTERVKQPMFGVMTKHWRHMLNEGLITQKEFAETTFNNYYRTEEEMRAPFEDKKSPVYRAGLRIVSMKTEVLPCPYNLAWLKSSKHCDDAAARRKHAKEFIPTTRVWSNSTFLSALDDNRSEKEKSQVVDELFRRYEDDVAKAPAEHAMDYVHIYLHFRKE